MSITYHADPTPCSLWKFGSYAAGLYNARSLLTQLAIGTIASVVGGIVFASSGKKAEKPATPAIQAGSSDEEKFIANFLKEQEALEKK